MKENLKVIGILLGAGILVSGLFYFSLKFLNAVAGHDIEFNYRDIGIEMSTRIK